MASGGSSPSWLSSTVRIDRACPYTLSAMFLIIWEKNRIPHKTTKLFAFHVCQDVVDLIWMKFQLEKLCQDPALILIFITMLRISVNLGSNLNCFPGPQPSRTMRRDWLHDGANSPHRELEWGSRREAAAHGLPGFNSSSLYRCILQACEHLVMGVENAQPILAHCLKHIYLKGSMMCWEAYGWRKQSVSRLVPA